MPTTSGAQAPWMIYGANGYTGRLCAEEAHRRGAAPLLAGRAREAVESVARPLGLSLRVFALDDPDAAAAALKGVRAVLNCAGPFSATAAPMLEACARAGAHYLDITGEIDVFEYVHARSDRWRDAGISALPGVGFDVVPTDCLAAMLKRDLPDATRLRLAIKSAGRISPGTAKTVLEQMPRGNRVRRAGDIVQVPFAHETIHVPFDGPPESALAIPWGDVSTAYYSTGIPDIETFMAVPESRVRPLRMARPLLGVLGIGPVRRLVRQWVENRVTGADEETRAHGEAWVWGEVVNPAGRAATRRLHTPDGYALTADAAVSAVEALLAGGPVAGALTPSLAFGPEFVLRLRGVEELEPTAV